MRMGTHNKHKQNLLGKNWCDYRFLSLCCIKIKSHFAVINKYNCNNDLGSHGSWGTNYFSPSKVPIAVYQVCKINVSIHYSYKNPLAVPSLSLYLQHELIF